MMKNVELLLEKIAEPDDELAVRYRFFSPEEIDRYIRNAYDKICDAISEIEAIFSEQGTEVDKSFLEIKLHNILSSAQCDLLCYVFPFEDYYN